MKKLVLFAAIIATVALSACKGKEAPAQDQAPATEQPTTPAPSTDATSEGTQDEAPATEETQTPEQ